MSDLSLIIRREFRERVHSRAFVLGTILFPVFMAALIILPGLFDRGGQERTIAVVDEAPAGVAARFVAILGAPPEDERANRYVVERIVGAGEGVRGALNRRVHAEEIDGYVVLPADVLETSEIVYRSGTIAGPTVLRDIRVAASQAVQAERLREAGLEVAEVASLLQPVGVENIRITATGEEGGAARSSFILAYVVALVLYFIIAFYGMSVMRSVLEEKTNRISEVLVSSVRTTTLMAGKILGVGSAAMLQVLIWAGFIALLITQSQWIAAQVGIAPEALGAVEIEPLLAILLLAFFASGFFLYAALFAGLGAAVTSEQEAQSLQMTIMVPLFVPLLFLMPLTTEPLGSIATALGLFPLTAPIAMPMRMAAAPIPTAQVVGSLVLVIGGLAVVAWLAGKVYRIGILSTGRKPTLKELGRWLRTA